MLPIISNSSYTKSKPHFKPKVALSFCIIVLVVSLSSWLHLLYPHPIIDEGAFINMIDAFHIGSRLDLMQWSQPSFLGAAIPAKIIESAGGQYWWYGVICSAVALAGIFRISLCSNNWLNSLIICLCLASFPDFAETVPTIMSDPVFLGYLVAALYCCSSSLNTANKSQVALGSLFGYFAMITRAHGFLLPASALLTWYRYRSRGLLFISLALTLGALAAAITISFFTADKIPLIQATVLPNIFLRHDYALFDVRATLLAACQLLVSVLPAVLLKHKWSRIRPADVLIGLFWLGVCVNFLLKHRPMLFGSCELNALGVLLIPVAATLLFRTLKQPSLKPQLSLLCLYVTLGDLMLMPISPHPLTRHLNPGSASLLIAIGTLQFRHPTKIAIRTSIATVVCLLSFAFATEAQLRVANELSWSSAEQLVDKGIPADQIYAGWSWFCVHNLVPNKISDFDFVKNLKRLRKDSMYKVVCEDASD